MAVPQYNSNKQSSTSYEPVYRNTGNVDEEYRKLINTVLEKGVVKEDRTGTGTTSMFGHMMRFNMALGFPLVTLKKTNFRPILQELLWMLDSVDPSYQERGFGPHNIKYLCDNNVTIWNEWPHKNYVDNCTDLDYLRRSYHTYADGSFVDEYVSYDLKEFAEKIRQDDEFARAWGDLGPVYGQQWRYWQGGVDQIEAAVQMLKNNPDSRRIMVTAWNPGDLPEQLLPPCHYCFQYWTRPMTLIERCESLPHWSLVREEIKSGVPGRVDFTSKSAVEEYLACHKAPTRKLSLMFNMRSVDSVLGMPFDIASYGLQLIMMAQAVNMVADELIVVSGDTHIYSNHLADIPQFIDRKAFSLPKVKINPTRTNMKSFRFEDFELTGYQSHPAVKFPIAV